MTQRGVTLVELLIAMMLLATALVAVAASSPLLMQAVTAGGFQTTATLLAEQCLALARSMPYERVPLDLEAGCPVAPAGYPAFRRTVIVAAASPTATTTTITVRVSVPGVSAIAPTTIATVVAP